MSTRPGEWAEATWRTNRSKRPCNLVQVTLTNGTVLRMTDHDRTITFEGHDYRPVVFAGMSADRRESGLSSGNQEVYGIIDGNYVVLPDLLGDRYRGAEVAHVVTDWSMPWLAIARHRRWIRSVGWTGSTFVATLEGRSQVLTRASGGRFGGTFSTTCPYKLGGPYCKASPILTIVGVRVLTVTTQRMVVTTAPGTYPASYLDDRFRDGEIVWRWSIPVVERQATSAVTTTLLTDSTRAWTVNEHVGRECRILTGTGGSVIDSATITANTATTMTLATLATTHLSGVFYDICGLCQNLDVVSPIVGYRDSDRRVSLLLPTPFDIAVGDSGTIREGCNGLFTTCKGQFGNQLNFGGDNEAPSAGKVVEPVREP